MSEYIVRETGYPGAVKQEVVAELVRCKDCKYSTECEDVRYCDHPKYSDYDISVNDEFCCGYGERSE